MKLDLDCVRAVLLAVESFESFTVSQNRKITLSSVSMAKLFEILSDYEPNVVAYTVVLLEEAGMLSVDFNTTDKLLSNFHIWRMTYSGHEFLEKIRDDSLFERIKFCLGSVGSFGLSAVSDVAGDLIRSGLHAAVVALKNAVKE